MNVRILNPEEYPLLKNFGDWDEAKLNPSTCVVVGAFEGEKLVGRCLLMPLMHVEGIWVDSSLRGSTIAFQMEQALECYVKNLGGEAVMALAQTEEMESYLKRLNFKQVATAWSKEI
jgi:hypothetical protein